VAWVKITQKDLDRWLPTIARFSGVFLTVGLCIAVALGHEEVVPGFVPAAGLMFYKTVKGAAGDGE
jgi:hypothetical protein